MMILHGVSNNPGVEPSCLNCSHHKFSSVVEHRNLVVIRLCHVHHIPLKVYSTIKWFLHMVVTLPPDPLIGSAELDNTTVAA